MGKVRPKDRGIHGSEVNTLTPQEIQQLTSTQLSNLSQTQTTIVIVQTLKTPYAVESISEIPDFIGSGLQNKVKQESRPLESISETSAVVVI